MPNLKFVALVVLELLALNIKIYGVTSRHSGQGCICQISTGGLNLYGEKPKRHRHYMPRVSVTARKSTRVAGKRSFTFYNVCTKLNR